MTASLAAATGGAFVLGFLVSVRWRQRCSRRAEAREIAREMSAYLDLCDQIADSITDEEVEAALTRILAERPVAAEGPAASFVCPRCERESWNPHDVEHGYCGACHDYTGVPHR